MVEESTELGHSVSSSILHGETLKGATGRRTGLGVSLGSTERVSSAPGFESTNPPQFLLARTQPSLVFPRGTMPLLEFPERYPCGGLIEWPSSFTAAPIVSEHQKRSSIVTEWFPVSAATIGGTPHN